MILRRRGSGQLSTTGCFGVEPLRGQLKGCGRCSGTGECCGHSVDTACGRAQPLDRREWMPLVKPDAARRWWAALVSGVLRVKQVVVTRRGRGSVVGMSWARDE